MPSLQQLLDSAPPARLADAHARRLGRSGLVQRSRIRQEFEAWILDPARLASLSGEPALLELARAVHLSGARGLAEAEAATLPGIEDPSGALHRLATDFVCAEAECAPPRWAGIAEFSGPVLSGWIRDRRGDAECPRPAPGAPFLEGLAALAGWLDAGRCRLNRGGTPNRRDRAALRERFAALAGLGEEGQELALDLALAFLHAREAVSSRASRLECRPELDRLLASRTDLAASVTTWWRQISLPGDTLWWDFVEGWGDSGMPAAACAEAFARREGSLPPTGLRWKDLPGLLRRALAAGMLEFVEHKGELVHVWPARRAEIEAPERPVSATSDFLVYLAPGAPLADRRLLESLAQREGSDVVARYRLTRDTFLSAAGQPAILERIPAFLERLAPPPGVAAQLAEWLASRSSCEFASLRVLRVRDPRRLAELASLPPVRSLVAEEIPGWGFALEPANEPLLRQILSNLGLEPPLAAGSEGPEPVFAPMPFDPLEEPGEEWEWPRDEAPPLRPAGSGSRYGGDLRELEYPDLLRLVEYAILVEADMELVLRQGSQARPLRVRPRHLERRKEPVSMQVRIGHESREIALETIRKARVLES